MDANEPEEPGRRARPDVSVVIPVFNEELGLAAGIEGVHNALRTTGLRYEVVVVDDGSTDRSAEIAESCDCRLIRRRANRGYGAALKHGIAHARADRIVIIDGDGTYPARSIPLLLTEADRYDMVVGARTGDHVHRSLLREPAKWFLRKLAEYLAERPIPDLNSGLRVLRRDHIQMFSRILPAGFSFTTTITLALLCTDRSVGYVSVDYRRRKGRSKIRPAHAYRFLILILRTIVLFNPLRVFLPLGAVAFLVGAAKFVYDVTLGDLSESAMMGLLGAVLIWTVGLLADQNSRLSLERWECPTPRSD